MEYQKIAKKQIEIIKKDFFQDNKLMYKPNVTVASLWDYSAYFTAIVKLYKTNPEEYKSLLDETLKNLEWYLAKNRTDGYLVYASENGNEKPVFYDDNVWLVIGFLELYEIKSEKKYLEKALRILDFIYDSWQTNLGGGLLWREFPDDLEKSNWVRNTCINAPTAYASLRVYELTNNPVYLEWGEKIYKWTKDNLEDSNTHLYFDNINHFGKVDKTYWTYNVGVMISAASLLFKITKDQKYETDSINSINGANNKLSAKHEDKENSFNYYDDHPWFRVYLFQGMLDAYVCLSINNKKKIEKYFDDVISGFEYMYEKYQDTNKLILNDWSKLHNKEDEVLFASGNLESICIFDEYQKNKRKGKNEV